MSNQNKSMNTTPQFLFGLNDILNALIKDKKYMAQIDNIQIFYCGNKQDTLNGDYEIFEIRRKI